MSHIVRAPAKINLTLEVLGRRPDGYHDLKTMLIAVDWFDELTFAPADTLQFTCSDPALAGPDNLVMRAARLLQATTGVETGATIHLTKRIPYAAGLGGGSSDAATTLRALNQLWQTGLSPEQILTLAAELGSDVPYFVLGGLCLAEGRGERLTPLPDLPDQPVLLVTPPLAVPTGPVFRATTAADYADGTRTDQLIARLRAGQQWTPDLLINSLEPVCFRLYPALADVAAALRAAGAPWIRLSGSGPTLYTLPESHAAAQVIASRLQLPGCRIHIGRTLSAAESLHLPERT
jgi:4-diphosphocytidyl-2-C-methyl-D-erythritol kinase